MSALTQQITTLIQQSKRSAVGIVASIFFGICLMTLGAQAAIPLSFTPVPITFQMVTALALGWILGPKKAFVSVMSYVALGAMGAPVFAFGSCGIFSFTNFGYLLALPFAAFVTGYTYQNLKGMKGFGLLVGLLAGNVVTHLVGLPWLACFVGFDKVLALGFLPFALPNLAQILLVAGCGWLIHRR